jgi:Trypsin
MILRHDLNDRECIVDAADWPSVVTFFGGDGAATLVADRWLLTAAHTAANLPPDHPVPIGGGEIRVTRVVSGPADLALVELAEPAGVAAIALHTEPDEVGQVALLLGRGDFGDGVDGVQGVDHRLRCVTNRIDAADDSWLRLRFDRPPDCTELEGVCGEGDSGGPALLRRRGRLTIAGVSSWQDHDGALGTYGCVEQYARVSTHADWIASVVRAPSTPPHA